jgi:dihydroorotate dehydrogenase
LIDFFGRLARPVLRVLDPESAHSLAIKALTLAPMPAAAADDARLAVDAFGLRFPNPVGIAAGFDKNAAVADPVLRLGLGFIEVGTVTPRPQAGNPAPRVFRLARDRAIINRLGFNNDGLAVARERLLARRGGGVVGINVGANKDTTDRIADYVRGIEGLAGLASYFTLNVSSPNTPGLRELQHRTALDELLARVIAARDRVAASAGRKPVLLKISPDLSLGELDEVVAVARRRRVDGMVVSNTTIARPPGLRDTVTATHPGGLSGPPLFERSTRILAETYVRAEGVFPLIGVGGIGSGEAALAKMRAGACLLQVYTGVVYKGLALVREIKQALLGGLDAGRATSLADLVGTDVATRTAEPWPP